MVPVTALDVAYYILSNYEISDMTNLKLQKLLYFIQGEYLAKTSRPLFDDEIVAWKYGPVVPEVYFNFNRFISYPIVLSEREKSQHKKNLPDCVISAIDSVMQEKGNLSAGKLVELTHQNESWIKTFDGGSGYNSIIPNREIKDSFSNQL